MAVDEPLPAEVDELVLFTAASEDAGLHIVSAALFLGIAVGDGWGSVLLLRHTAGAALGLGAAAACVIGLPALWLLDKHARQVAGWWRWRNRPVPAMRLTAAGLDYSPAYTGGFPLHVDWAVPMESAYRQGPDNYGFFWCLYAPAIDGLGRLPASIHRAWPLDPYRMRRELRQLVRDAGVDERSREQMAAATHLITYGTPIVINLHFAAGSPLAAVDARLRERTGGRCTLNPPPHRIGATTRARTY